MEKKSQPKSEIISIASTLPAAKTDMQRCEIEYDEELRKTAHYDAWNTVIKEPVKALGVSVFIFMIAVVITLAVLGGSEAQSFWISSGIGVASLLVAYLILLGLNYCYSTPKKLYLNKQREVNESHEVIVRAVESEREETARITQERDLLKAKLESKPMLEMRYSEAIQGCYLPGDGSPGGFDSFRLAVTARNGTITRCKGHITKVEIDGRKKFGGNEALLTFALAENDDATDKTIPVNATRFLDVLDTNAEGVRGIRVKNEEWPTHYPPIRKIFDTIGEYLITIQVSGLEAETIEASFKLTLKTDGRQSTFEQSSESHAIQPAQPS
jgi:hypothetical protein